MVAESAAPRAMVAECAVAMPRMMEADEECLEIAMERSLSQDLERVGSDPDSPLNATPSPAPQPSAPTPEVSGYTVGSETAYLEPVKAALAAGGEAAAYSKYLELREANKSSPSYFMYVAQMLFKEGGVSLERMVQIVTSPLELGLQDVQLFRSVAYFLLEAGAMEEALSVLNRVLTLAPSEPTSFVDLALGSFLQVYRRSVDTPNAEADKQQIETAIGHMAEVISGKWENRFEEIQVPCLVLLNWMVSWAKQYSEKSVGEGWDLWPGSLPDKFREPANLDMLVWLGWDTDRTDLDLHVHEPSEIGQEVFYSNKMSAFGYITKDFTQGYGPEVYMAGCGAPGDYQVKCHYYASHQATAKTGTTSAVVWAITKMGTWDEETLTFRTVRLSGQKQTHDVMTVNLPGDLDSYKTRLGIMPDKAEAQPRLAEMPEIALLASGDSQAEVGVGQTVCHNTSTGFGAMMRPTNPRWNDEFILINGSEFVKYETKNTTPQGLCGGAQFQHQFTGVRPGRAEFSTPYGTLRLTVTAALS